MDVALVLNYTWPGCFREITRAYEEPEDLQTFLDTEVIWETGQEKTAAEVLAVQATYESFKADQDATRTAQRAGDIATIQDTAIRAVMTYTPTELETWVDNNVNDLADARAVFKTVLKICRYLSRNELRD